MNTLKARQLFRNAWRLAAFIAVIFAAGGVHAQGQPVPAQGQQQQAARFLIIFETSPVMKKNLPMIKDMLGEMFSGNLQNEMKTGDDLAVWTVDDKLHTGTFPLENWSPDEAAEYAGRLNDFLGNQKFRRSATLSATQPLLDHVVKNSERLTVLIFCDSQSHLTGTPYDDGVNDIITNAAAKLQGGPKPFIVLLRAYHGEYLGCSVNRSGLLNFPKFPAPPKPQPPPVVKEAPAPPVTPATGPVVTPIQALIIVGTNASTNASAALKPPATTVTTPPPQPTVAPATATTPAPAPSPQPAANPPAPTPTPAVTPAPTTPASIILSGPPPKPTPVPAPVPPPQNVAPTPTTPAPETQVVTAPAPVTPAAPETAPATNSAATATETSSTDTGYVWPLVIAGAAIALAIVIVLWLVMRGRRPQGSLITSSMADDPRLPPRK
jgi:hypothetical protein